MRNNLPRISLEAKWSEGLGKKGNMQGVVLLLRVEQEAAEVVTKDVVNDIVDRIEEIGKKKNRVGGKDYGYGVPLRVELQG